MRLSFNGRRLENNCNSFAVLICKICSRVSNFCANCMAFQEDSKQASTSLTIGWSEGSKCAFTASNAALFFLITLSSSQCVAINNSDLLNILSKITGLSTNKLPVEEPINILTPHTSFFFLLVFKTSSTLS